MLRGTLSLVKAPIFNWLIELFFQLHAKYHKNNHVRYNIW